MSCPRCDGHSVTIDVVSGEGELTMESCLNCGAIFGEPLLDRHQSLDRLPPPYPAATLPVWDPVKHRLRIATTLLEPKKERLSENRLPPLAQDG
jgi:hypothetical protein